MDQIIEFEFKQKVVGLGLYCRVALKIDIIENSKDIQYTSNDLSISDFRGAIDFSIDCFKSIFYKQYPNCGANIIIYRLGVIDVDTRNCVVFYVLLSALCKAIEYKLNGLELNIESGSLIIPAIL